MWAYLVSDLAVSNLVPYSLGDHMKYFLVVHNRYLMPVEVIEFSTKEKAYEARSKFIRNRQKRPDELAIGSGTDMADFFDRYEEYRTQNWQELVWKYC